MSTAHWESKSAMYREPPKKCSYPLKQKVHFSELSLKKQFKRKKTRYSPSGSLSLVTNNIILEAIKQSKCLLAGQCLNKLWQKSPAKSLCSLKKSDLLNWITAWKTSCAAMKRGKTGVKR